jgi:hypothetical protein
MAALASAPPCGRRPWRPGRPSSETWRNASIEPSARSSAPSRSIITALRLLDARTPVALAYLTAHPDGRPDGVRDLAGSLAKRLDAGAQVAAESAQTAFARVTRDNLDEMAVAAVGAAVDARSIRWSLGRWATMQTQTIGRQATSRGVSDRVGEGGQVTIHTGECSWCAEHAGVAVIGQDPLPPFHPNCSCVATAA